MARPRTHRLKIKGTLETTGPLHVGGMHDSVETDMPLARDGLGRLYVPGTSLAGPMRAWVEEEFDDLLAQQMWGFQKQDGDTGYASYVMVEDAHIEVPDGLDEEIWDGVGIDRQWGVAAEGIKFDRAILPRGTTLDLEMTLELPPEDPNQSASKADPAKLRAVVGHLLQALEQGAIGLGAARTRGLGRVKLVNVTIHEEDWSKKDGILKVLRGGTDISTKEKLVQASPTTTPSQRSRVRIEIEWEPDGPVMVKAGQDGVSVDMLPMISGCGARRVGMVLPGNSLKGALRSQAERVVRTVCGIDPATDWAETRQRKGGRQVHREQVAVPLVEHLFGSAKKAAQNQQQTGEGAPRELETEGSSPPPPGRGVLQVDTCYSTNLSLSSQQWQAIATAESTEADQPRELSALYQALASAQCPPDPRQPRSPYFQQAFHVAVDRWTGGAAEGFLYSTLEPFGVSWEPIVLTVELGSRRLPTRLEKPALVLLLLLLRDLARNRIPIGFGGHRGHGSIKVVEARIIPQDVAWLSRTTLPQGDLTKLRPEELLDLEKAWNGWIDQASGREVQQ